MGGVGAWVGGLRLEGVAWAWAVGWLAWGVEALGLSLEAAASWTALHPPLLIPRLCCEVRGFLVWFPSESRFETKDLSEWSLTFKYLSPVHHQPAAGGCGVWCQLGGTKAGLKRRQEVHQAWPWLHGDTACGWLHVVWATHTSARCVTILSCSLTSGQAVRGYGGAVTGYLQHQPARCSPQPPAANSNSVLMPGA